MIQDAYVEHLVKWKTPPYAIAVKVLLGILFAVALFMALTTYIGILVLLAVCALSYFVLLNLNIEFEYLYIDGQLSMTTESVVANIKEETPAVPAGAGMGGMM